MILAASSLFVCLEFVGRHPGLLLVLIGVVGEIICDWKEMEGRLARAKRISAILLVVGLMMEFWEAAVSDTDLADTKERTAVAEKEAGQANERAANTESNNLVLQAELKDRTITVMQITNFIFLMEKVKKIPIKVEISDEGGDVETFACQIRNLLSVAGFQTNSDAGIWGINRERQVIMARKIGASRVSSVTFLCNSTNKIENVPIQWETFNGSTRFIVTENDQIKIYEAIKMSFDQIGIDTQWQSDASLVKDEECEIIINPKSY